MNAYEQPAEETEFDLSPVVDRYYRGMVWYRVFAIALGLSMPTFTILRIFYATVNPPYIGVVIVTIVAAPFFVAVGLFRGAPPPRQLRITGQGLTFRFRDGHLTSYRWDDPNLRLALRDSRTPGSDSEYPEVRYAFASFGVDSPLAIFQRVIPLTTSAFLGILQSAAANGLSIRPSDWREAPERSRIVRVRASFPSRSVEVG